MSDPQKDIWVSFRLGQYFRKGSHKTALSVPELVAQTNAFSVKNRPGCTPTLEKSDPKSLFLRYNVKCNLPESNPNGHDVKIHFDLSQVDDDTSAKNLDVAVNCSCPAFLYWGGQWNAHQRDALEGEPRPLLTAPTERLDLREHFVICKHIKAVSERILPSVQFNINNILRKRHVEEYKAENPDKAPKKLDDKQREMRERQEKQKAQKPRNRQLNEKFKQNTTPPVDDVVKRDTPATPEERERVPRLSPEEVPTPDAHFEHGNLPEIPEIEGLEETPAPQPPATRPAPPKPQRSLPRPGEQDRAEMNRLMREEQRRLDRETQRKLQLNPGRRR